MPHVLSSILALLLLIGVSLYSYHGSSGLLDNFFGPCPPTIGHAQVKTTSTAVNQTASQQLNHPWRFTFESQAAMDLKRQAALRRLRKHLENPRRDMNGTLVNRDDDCLRLKWHEKDDAGSCMFAHIRAFINLRFLQRPNNNQLGREIKAMADPRLFGDSCVAFCAGISSDSTFEQALARACPTVHAFDCTVNPEHVHQSLFRFHQVCIGDNEVTTTDYYKEHHGTQKHEMVTKSVETIVSDLNLTAIDIFKFDIEGYEWNVLEHILSLPPALRPVQVLFELHTTGAHELVVPPSVVAGKRQREVDELFVRLLEAGYGIMDVSINDVDNRCAEVSLLKII